MMRTKTVTKGGMIRGQTQMALAGFFRNGLDGKEDRSLVDQYQLALNMIVSHANQIQELHDRLKGDREAALAEETRLALLGIMKADTPEAIEAAMRTGDVVLEKWPADLNPEDTRDGGGR